MQDLNITLESLAQELEAMAEEEIAGVDCQQIKLGLRMAAKITKDFI